MYSPELNTHEENKFNFPGKKNKKQKQNFLLRCIVKPINEKSSEFQEDFKTNSLTGMTPKKKKSQTMTLENKNVYISI